MKTFTICLPDAQAAMLVEVLKRNKAYRSLRSLVVGQVQEKYANTAAGRLTG